MVVPKVKTPKQSPKISPKKSHPKTENNEGGAPSLSPANGSPKNSPKNTSPKPSPKKLKPAKDTGSAGQSPKLPAKKILGSKNQNVENIPSGAENPKQGVEVAPIAVPKSSPSRLRRGSTFDEIKEEGEVGLANGTDIDPKVGKATKLEDSPGEPQVGHLDEIREEADESESHGASYS